MYRHPVSESVDSHYATIADSIGSRRDGMRIL